MTPAEDIDPKEKAPGDEVAKGFQQNTSSTDSAYFLGNPQDLKRYKTLQARAALLGRELTRSHRAGDGRISYVVLRRGDCRYFSTLHDVAAHLASIGGAR